MYIYVYIYYVSTYFDIHTSEYIKTDSMILTRPKTT